MWATSLEAHKIEAPVPIFLVLGFPWGRGSYSFTANLEPFPQTPSPPTTLDYALYNFATNFNGTWDIMGLNSDLGILNFSQMIRDS